MQVESPPAQPAKLLGLVLAGGDSSRMGDDKGAIQYHGVAHAVFLRDLLASRCEVVFVSINSHQASRPPYAGLPIIVDARQRIGPATGLLAAHAAHPAAAWFAVAVDLALLDEVTVASLVKGRRPTAAATAYRNRDGIIEPLCAIWEPTGLALLAQRAAAGDPSPRRCLETVDVEILECANPAALVSVDSPQRRDALLERQRRSQ